MIINLKRKNKSNLPTNNEEEIQKTYIPYKEQKRRKRQTNKLTAAGLGISGAAGGAYYLGKSAKIDRLANRQKDELARYSNHLYNKANETFVSGQRLAEEQLSQDLANVKGKKFLGMTLGKGRQQRNLYKDFHRRSNNALQSHSDYVNGLESKLKENFKTIDNARSSKKGKAGLIATGIAAGGAALTLAARKYKKRKDKEV